MANKKKLYFDVFTGETTTRNSIETRLLKGECVPYYNLEGKYFGFKTEFLGFVQGTKGHLKFYNSYWDLQP